MLYNIPNNKLKLAVLNSKYVKYYNTHLMVRLFTIVINILLSNYTKSILKTRLNNSSKSNNSNSIKSKFINKLISSNSLITYSQKSSSLIINLHSYWSTNQFRFNSNLNVLRKNSHYITENKICKKSLRYFIRNIKIYSNNISALSNMTVRNLNNINANLRLKNINNFWRLRKKKLKVTKVLSRRLKNKRLISPKKFTSRYFIDSSKKLRLSIQRSRRVKRSVFRKKIFRGLKFARDTLKKLLGIRKKGKNRLVRFIKSMNNKSFFNKLMLFELSLMSILLKSKLVSSLNDASYLASNGMVFINGKLNSNLRLPLAIGDRLQIPITASSYMWLNYRKKKLFNSYKKVNQVLWRRIRRKRSKFGKRSYRYPRWLFKYALLETKLPLIIELDLLLLTVVLIYKPFKLNEINSPIWRYININCHSLYLWKLTN